MALTYTNFLLMRYISTPPTPEAKGGARKASVASIYEIGIKRKVVVLWNKPRLGDFPQTPSSRLAPVGDECLLRDRMHKALIGGS